MFVLGREKGFDPRPREGGDNGGNLMRVKGIVSIHAPVKEATSKFQTAARPSYVSIHAPVKEATPYQ